jgi:hypothetical protein
MEPSDIRLTLDVAVGWLVGKVSWVIIQELLIKPLAFKMYRKTDSLVGDKLPDLE